MHFLVKKPKILTRHILNKTTQNPNFVALTEYQTTVFRDNRYEVKHMKNDENERHDSFGKNDKPNANATTPVINAPHNIHCLSIIGQVEGHNILPPNSKATKYEDILPTLINIEENRDIEGLLILLNTVGGDVEAGLAIAEMISSMSKPTVSIVLGGGHSIGVPLAVSSKKSFIVPSATMTIHPIRTNGLVIGAIQTYEYFNKVQDRVVSFISKNSNISKEKLLSLMLATGIIANDVGTILFGEEAVKCGIIDYVGGISSALKELYKLIENPGQDAASNES